MSPRNVVKTDFPRAELPLQDADRLINGKHAVSIRTGDNIIDKGRYAVRQPLQNVFSTDVIDDAAPNESPGAEHTPAHLEERDNVPHGKIIERRSHNDDIIFLLNVLLHIVKMRQSIHMIRHILAVRQIPLIRDDGIDRYVLLHTPKEIPYGEKPFAEHRLNHKRMYRFIRIGLCRKRLFKIRHMTAGLPRVNLPFLAKHGAHIDKTCKICRFLRTSFSVTPPK